MVADEGWLRTAKDYWVRHIAPNRFLTALRKKLLDDWAPGERGTWEVVDCTRGGDTVRVAFNGGLQSDRYENLFRVLRLGWRIYSVEAYGVAPLPCGGQWVFVRAAPYEPNDSELVGCVCCTDAPLEFRP